MGDLLSFLSWLLGLCHDTPLGFVLLNVLLRSYDPGPTSFDESIGFYSN